MCTHAVFDNYSWGRKSSQRLILNHIAASCCMAAPATTSAKDCSLGNVLHRINVGDSLRPINILTSTDIGSACIASIFALAYRIQISREQDATWLFVPLGIVTYVLESLFLRRK